jgi:SAM-dependent methyltransferase
MAFDPEAIREFERSSWNRSAAGYEASFAPATTPFIPALLDAVGVAPGDRLLDMCCGPGRTAVGAAQRGAVVNGLDFSRAMVEVARSQCASVTFDEGDAEALPYADATFDAVVSSFGMHHVPRPTVAMAEAYRVLRPGGRFAFTVWTRGPENVGLALVSNAIERHGDPTLTTAPPTGPDLVSTSDKSIAALREVGFVQVRARTESQVWRLANGRALLDALRNGTAQSSARIAAQPANALPAIIADVEKHAALYRDAEGIAVPMVAVLAFGIKGAPLAFTDPCDA